MNWHQNYVNNWCKLTINHRSEMEVFVLLKSNWHQLFPSNWCCTLTILKNQQKSFQPKFVFTDFVCQWSFSRHILDIILTSCVDVSIFAIWHKHGVKIRSIDVVSWYWPIFDISLRFKCPMGCLIVTVCMSFLFVI